MLEGYDIFRRAHLKAYGYLVKSDDCSLCGTLPKPGICHRCVTVLTSQPRTLKREIYHVFMAEGGESLKKFRKTYKLTRKLAAHYLEASELELKAIENGERALPQRIKTRMMDYVANKAK